MGPHGLVVGATGSGKSEMLRTLVSSLVISHGPDRLALMLVDFKGGATFAAMEHIPHLAGRDHQPAGRPDAGRPDAGRAVRRDAAPPGDAQGRPATCPTSRPTRTGSTPGDDARAAAAPAGDHRRVLRAAHRQARLRRAVRRHRPDRPLDRRPPAAGPQKLEIGKIRGLESHLSYRISLRTFSEGESRDVIGVPDAYHLPPEPGSGYLKVDTTVFERFKAALVSGPYRPPTEGPEGDRAGRCPTPPSTGSAPGSPRTQAAPAADERRRRRTRLPAGASARCSTSLCDRLVAPRRRPGPPGLARPAAAGDDRSTESGRARRPRRARHASRRSSALVDEPGKQRQFPLEWDFTGGGGNLVVAGSPQSGKSALLATHDRCRCRCATRPATWCSTASTTAAAPLRGLEDLPHVAAVATRIDAERIQRTINDVLHACSTAARSCSRRTASRRMRDFRRARAERPDPGRRRPVTSSSSSTGGAPSARSTTPWRYVVGDIAARGLGYGVHVVMSVTPDDAGADADAAGVRRAARAAAQRLVRLQLRPQADGADPQGRTRPRRSPTLRRAARSTPRCPASTACATPTT